MTKEMENQIGFVKELFNLTEIFLTVELSFKDNFIAKDLNKTVSQHKVFWLMAFIWDYLRDRNNYINIPLTTQTFKKLFSFFPQPNTTLQNENWDNFKEEICKSKTPLTKLEEKIESCSSQSYFIFSSRLTTEISDFAKNEAIKTTNIVRFRKLSGIGFKVIYIALILSIYCQEQNISIEVQNEIYIKLFLATKQKRGREAVLESLKSFGYNGTAIKKYIDKINEIIVNENISDTDKCLDLLSEKNSESINLIVGRLFHIGRLIDTKLSKCLEVSPDGNVNDKRENFIKGLTLNNLAYVAILIFHRNCLPSNNYDVSKKVSSPLTKDGENVYWWLINVWNKG